MPSKSFSLKKYIFKISYEKNAFSKLLPKKILFKNCLLKKYGFELLPEKKYFHKIAQKNINLIALNYSLSEPSTELSKSSIICLIIFFSMYLLSFRNTFAQQFLSLLRAAFKVISVKQVWLEFTLGIFYHWNL